MTATVNPLVKLDFLLGDFETKLQVFEMDIKRPTAYEDVKSVDTEIQELIASVIRFFPISPNKLKQAFDYRLMFLQLEGKHLRGEEVSPQTDSPVAASGLKTVQVKAKIDDREELEFTETTDAVAPLAGPCCTIL